MDNENIKPQDCDEPHVHDEHCQCGETEKTSKYPPKYKKIGSLYPSHIQSTLGRGVMRNQPCPCGKKDAEGNPVKYKKCCGKNK